MTVLVGSAICDGGIVAVRRQDIADHGNIVALLEGEATVKRLPYQGGRVWLMPRHPAYEAIEGESAAILGEVAAVLRTL